MEEYAFLSNIASIITKDLLIDESNSRRQPKHFLWHGDQINGDAALMQYPLIEKDNDEDIAFFLRQQLHQQKIQRRSTEAMSKSNECKSKNFNKRAKSEPDDKRNSFESSSMPIKNKNIDLLNQFDNGKFESFLHMNKMSFLKIFQFVRNFLTSHPWPSNVTPQTVFSLALWKLTTDEHFEMMAQRFEILSSIDCQTLIGQFWQIISDSYETYIRWPNSQLSQKIQIQGFQQHPRLKIFPQLFGIIAIKHLNVFLISEGTEIPIVLQIICNADQKVVDCFVELTNDYKFEETPVGQILNLNSNTIPKGSYIIGDESFPLKPYVMRPFAMPYQRREHEFNRLLEIASQFAHDTLDIMAKRFNALYALEARDLTEVRKILETICALHNLNIAIEDDYVERKFKNINSNININNNNHSKIFSHSPGTEDNLQGLEKRQNLLDILIKDNYNNNVSPGYEIKV